MKQNKRVVLIGYTGSGKTTLFNRLTGQKEKTSSYGDIATKQIALGQSCSNNPFEVIDTPGLGGVQNILQHIGGILAALQYENIHQIVLVVKFDRLSFIHQFLGEQMEIFQRYKDGITVFFSMCQRSDTQNREIIQKELMNKYQIKSVIFNQEDKDVNHELIEQFNKILNNSQDLKIQFSDNEIFSNFKH